MSITWFYLALAIILETTGTTCIKISNGLTLPGGFLFVVFLLYAASLSLFPLLLKEMELSVAYGIWAGLGSIWVTGIGIFVLHETATPIKLIGIGLIIIGTVGLKLGSTAPQEHKQESFSTKGHP